MGRKEKNGALGFLYHTVPGRICLKLLTARWISRLCGAFMDSRLSKALIKSFVEKNDIDLSQFESSDFGCFNECFCRKIKEGLRPIPEDETQLFSPCDGLLSAYRLQAGQVIPVKQSAYTLETLLQNPQLAQRYQDGVCLVFRLCVNHYHRYCYPASGVKGENVFIKGKLHTVRPIALEVSPVFTENCREYTVLETKSFGAITQMEVGAMLVGKIKNHHGSGPVVRGTEKGMFLYGGSTVIVLLEREKAAVAAHFFASTDAGIETPVVMGQSLSQ